VQPPDHVGGFTGDMKVRSKPDSRSGTPAGTGRGEKAAFFNTTLIPIFFFFLASFGLKEGTAAGVGIEAGRLGHWSAARTSPPFRPG